MNLGVVNVIVWLSCCVLRDFVKMSQNRRIMILDGLM